MNNYKILLVDSNAKKSILLKQNLEKEGFSVDINHSMDEYLCENMFLYDFFLIDFMLKENSGIELAVKIRQQEETKDTPIFFLSSSACESDKIKAFENGADDFIVQPISIKEISAKIKVLAKRSYHKHISHKDFFIYKNLSLNSSSGTVLVKNKDIELTKTEFKIFELLILNPNKVFSRKKIMSYIWKDKTNINERTIDVNVRRIRKKIKLYDKHIKTKSGYGYFFEK